MLDNGRVRNLVMLGILVMWMVYFGATIARNQQPEKWAWGIVPGAYAALYLRPGASGSDRGVEDGQDRRQLPGRRRPSPRRPSAGDDET